MKTLFVNVKVVTEPGLLTLVCSVLAALGVTKKSPLTR